MKNKKLLAIILLSLSFCFVSGVAYGEVKEWLFETEIRQLELLLLKIQVTYIMDSPDSFLNVSYYYDDYGVFAEQYPAGVRTKDKIVVSIVDKRGIFSGKLGEKLVLEFKSQLWNATYYLGALVTDLENDIVARFSDTAGNPLGYFYQGEYHLWEE